MSSTNTENLDPSPRKKPRLSKNPQGEMSNENIKDTPDENQKVAAKLRVPLGDTSNQHGKLVSKELTPRTAEQKPVQFVSSPTFSLYRKPLTEYNGDNQFDKLSDEIVLQIFKNLSKVSLMKLYLVCERFRRISSTDILWTRLDLAGRNYRPGAIVNIISRGVVILRMAQAEIQEPIFGDTPQYMNWDTFMCKLQFLDLSMTTISTDALQQFLSKCIKLKKLSLEHVPVDDDVLQAISMNRGLESLNLAMVDGITADGLDVMLSNLTNLKNLNISWTYLDTESVTVLVKKVTTNVIRLNMSGCKKTLSDNHLRVLVKRCPHLAELDVSDCVELTQNGIEAVGDLKEIEYLSLSRCYNIEISNFLLTQTLPTLRFIDVFGIVKNETLEILSKSYPNIGFNKFIYSSVSRPTIGTRRTSIWGLRTRD